MSPPGEGLATELLRACRPRGTVGVLSWTPSGLGELFKMIARYPSPERKPPGADAGAAGGRGLPGPGPPGSLRDTFSDSASRS